jgi:hypothetical protein
LSEQCHHNAANVYYSDAHVRAGDDNWLDDCTSNKLHFVLLLVVDDRSSTHARRDNDGFHNCTGDELHFVLLVEHDTAAASNDNNASANNDERVS